MTPRADSLTVEVVDLIGTVVARFHEEYERAAAEHSLTGAQARLLRLLAMEPMPMRRLAQSLKCEPSNVTGIVDRLESRGLVERRPDPADRRVKLAVPTPEGRATAERLRTSLDFAREPLGRLTVTERTLLKQLLQQMLGIDPEEAPTDPAGSGVPTDPGRARRTDRPERTHPPQRTDRPEQIGAAKETDPAGERAGGEGTGLPEVAERGRSTGRRKETGWHRTTS